MDCIEKRLLTIKILGGMKRDPSFSQKLGLEDKSYFKTKNLNEKEKKVK